MAKIRIKNLRDALNEYKRIHPDITWSDMADAIGINPQSLFNYISGRATPRLSTLTMIAKTLELDVEAFLETEEEPEEVREDIQETVPPEADKEEPENEPEPPKKEKTTAHAAEKAKQKMTVRDVCESVVSDLKITFDEDPHDGEIDVIIPVSAEPTDILGERILNLEVNLMLANGDALIISTNSRRENE